MRRVATVLVPIVVAGALALTTGVPAAVAAPAAPLASLRADFDNDGTGGGPTRVGG
jgi:hypothetical protein